MLITFPLKQSLYPKTSRASDNNRDFLITEKLDGSNLAIFKLEDKIYVAQRNFIFRWEDVTPSDTIYKGLVGWMEEHHDHLLANMHNKSAIVGEWIGMGKIPYAGALEHRFYMFAKANVELEEVNDDDGKLFEHKLVMKTILYNRDLFIYPFVDQTIPDYIGLVPVVSVRKTIPTIKDLDSLYDELVEARPYTPEGFIVNLPDNRTVLKYVRHKNGKLVDHHS